ncbi:MAG: methyltransferase domain-containing protein [Deltaproteobacteria bacterium]
MDLSERPAGDFRRHPWEIARARFFRDVLRSRGVLDPRGDRARTVLDVGAGDAWFSQQLLAELPGSSRITCWDAEYTPEAIAMLSARDAGRIEFVSGRPRGTFDLVVLLDVLEHVEHEGDFLASLVRENVGTHTTVLVSVPAWQSLFTSHDARLRHYRRYSPARATRMLSDAGLTVDLSGGLFHSLVVPRAIERAREALVPPPADSIAPDALEWRAGKAATAAVRWALAADNAISRWTARAGVSLPGLSWWAVCHRP